ncbi:hypothetical protein HMPREF9554_00267 [Treponema phagedenis F0421]|nr:hypothetical protein HMPREF9554_00267 [Treponema phagedenis F0421]TYT78127.1 hypothetical protein FS559_02780 [Treponema phagedenis]
MVSLLTVAPCRTQNKFKRCLKASVQNCKIEALKLARHNFATDVKTQNNVKLADLILTRTSKLRTGTDARGSKQQRCFKAK